MLGMSTTECCRTAQKNSTTRAAQPATQRPTVTHHAAMECIRLTPGRVDSTSSCPLALSRLNSPATMAAGIEKYRISPMLVSAPKECQKSDYYAHESSNCEHKRVFSSTVRRHTW